MSKKGTLIIPSNIHAQLTGAVRAHIYPHEIELVYMDGTTETAKRNHPAFKALDQESWFSLVSCVQAAAR